MSYNVRSLNRNDNIPLANVDSSIISFMLKETPDILVVQEAHYAMRSITPLDEMYPYKFVDFEYGVPQTNVINALYSKYPITNVQLIDFPKSDNGALFVDIALKSDTIRVYNAHLQSFNVVPDMEHLQNEASRKLFRRIIQVLKRQEEQVLTILEHIIVSPYPVLLAGDLNNTQFSKVYRVMRSDLQDSFLEAGSGFGKTFKIFDLPMRIDYIFADRHFEVTEHTNYNVELSDHEPVMARLRLKSDK
ncbi:MAG: endonuclease/exonuclease/phosphatase family protein [Bacteroidota bacterium]